jgi:alkanesulfonate monooxygenase SsuD/methylene tetrahydromethanopterin reductase-like flavin-dependent oxidoreductase (luciferase family)
VHFTVSNFPGMGWNERSRKVVDLAVLCEELGIERFAIEDNRFHHDCFALITACLEATQRLVVECLVTDPFVRPPYLTARTAGTIADLSNGRLILGWGGGLERPAFSGETRLHPMQAVRESIEVCRRLWSGERVDMEGEVIRTLGAVFDFAPTPFIPILIAARGKGMLRLAGEIAEVAHMASVFIDPEHLRENVALVLAGARRGERPVDSFEIDMSVPIWGRNDEYRHLSEPYPQLHPDKQAADPQKSREYFADESERCARHGLYLHRQGTRRRELLSVHHGSHDVTWHGLVPASER